IWIESKMLPLTVGNRRILANALRVLMPCDYAGPALTLYRGAGERERRTATYGFCWTSDIAEGRRFAQGNVHVIPMTDSPPLRLSGVLLRTEAPADAVLLIRQPKGYYDEGEVVVDPFRLKKVACVERLNPPERTDP